MNRARVRYRRLREWMLKRGRERQLPLLQLDPKRLALRSMATRDAAPCGDAALPDLDISIVTYNSARWMKGFFDSLLALDYPLSQVRLLATDHGSSDGTVELLRSFQAGLGASLAEVIVRERPNRGFGAGHNANFEFAKAPYFLVSNVDLAFEPDALTVVVRHAVGDADNIGAWELRQIPFEHPKYYDPITLEVAWNSGACTLYCSEAYRRVAGYDDKIFMYCEDVDLSFRLRAGGYHLRYCPHAVVHHHTYEDTDTFKPLQFAGAVFGSLYLRFRFAGAAEIGRHGLRLVVLLMREGFNSTKGVMARKAVRQALPHFRRLRRERLYRSGRFGFVRWDYEIQRRGAFYPVVRQADGPLVSIVTRTMPGRGEWLREVMATVQQQTYRNIEHIIVEDGGNSAAAQANTGRPGLRYIALNKVGRSIAGNFGLAAARGTYLMFLDDDDALFADHVETLVATLLANQQAQCAYSIGWQVRSRSMSLQPLCYVDDNFSVPPGFFEPYRRERLQDANLFPIQSVLFHRSLYEQCGGFDPGLEYLEDWNLWLRYSRATTFVGVDKTTSLFRVRSRMADDIARSAKLTAAVERAKASARMFEQGASLRPPARLPDVGLHIIRAAE